MAGRTLTIDIKTADAQTLAALKRIQKELKDTGQVADRTSKQGLSLGGALGGLAIGAGITKSIGEFEEAETTARATAAAIEATGNAAGVSAEQQDKLVESLSKTAAIDDEVVAGAANMLRQFDQIKGARFGETLAASADIAAAKNMELAQSSQLLGKALQDPFTGYTKLQRVIGPFSDSAKAQIAAFEKVNDVAGAQGVILAELEKRFGGQAEAAVTDSAKMKIAFDNAAESLGASLAPALGVAADGAERVSEVFQGLPQPIQQGAVALGAVAFIAPKVARGWEAISDATTNAEGATSRMGKALGAAGIVAAAGAGVLALNEYREATSGLKVDVEALMASTDEAIARDLVLYKQFIEQADLEEVGRQNIDALYAMRDALKANGDEAIPELTAAIKVVEAEQARAADRAKEYGDANAGAVAPTDDLTGSVNDLSTAMGGFLANAEQYADANDAVASAGEAVNQAVVGVADAQDRVAQAEQGVADAEQSVADASEQVASAREGVTAAEEGLADARRGVADALEDVTDAEKGALAAREDVTQATEDLAQAQRDALIDSEYMADVLEGVADAEERLADSQADSQAAQEALTEARAGYGDVLESLASKAAGAADDVLSAEIRVREAQQALADLGKPDKDGKVEPVSADDRTKAEIAVREAQRRLEDAQKEAEAAAAEAKRQKELGVEGSDEVVAAKDEVAAAAGRQQEAEENLTDAVQTVAEKQEEANGRVEQAQRDLTSAIDDRIAADQRVIDAKQGVIDANGLVQKAAEGVRDANKDVATAVDNVRGAQQKVTDAKDAVVTARDAVRKAERDVETAVKDQYKAYQDLSELFKPGSAARERIEWLTGQMEEQYGYLTTPAPDYFTSLFGGKSAPGGKSEAGMPGGKSKGGDAQLTGSNVTTDEAAKILAQYVLHGGEGLTAKQKGEASVYLEDAKQQLKGPEAYKQWTEALTAFFAGAGGAPPGAGGPQGKTVSKSVTINLNGHDDPAAIAEWAFKRAGWELDLMGAA